MRACAAGARVRTGTSGWARILTAMWTGARARSPGLPDEDNPHQVAEAFQLNEVPVRVCMQKCVGACACACMRVRAPFQVSACVPVNVRVCVSVRMRMYVRVYVAGCVPSCLYVCCV